MGKQRLWVQAAMAAGLWMMSASGTAAEVPADTAATPATPAETRETMAAIFAELQILLPAAVRSELGDPKRAKDFEAALEGMERKSKVLQTHGSGLEPGSRLFGRALSRDVRRARFFFDREQYDSAGFLVEELVDDCISCHTRLSADDSLITRGFVDQPGLKGLDPLEHAALSVATRRFDDAMERYEKVFVSREEHPEILLGPITRYLTVTLRVARDPGRAHRLIAKLAKYPELSSEAQKDFEHWMSVLATLSADDFKGTDLARAREAVQSADKVSEYPGDPRALIEYLVASSQLQEIVLLPQESPAAAAEVYELLGHADLGVGQSVWQSRADLYWETAIRLAPKSPAAKSAYERLEKETLAGFTGSGGLDLPTEEKERLAALRSLMEDKGVDSVKEWEQERYGARLFAQHCALCHGANGEGRGIYSPILMSIPKDLTRIATRRDGAFPDAEVFALIARRDPLGNHQSPEMPRWGEFWNNDAKLDALVVYLRSIQQR